MNSGLHSQLSSTYTTAKAASSSFLTNYVRPASTIYKALGKLSLSSTTTISDNTIDATDKRASGSEKTLYVAASLRRMFQKLTKYENKIMKLEKQIHSNMMQWSSNVHEPVSAEILRAFAEVIEMERKLQLAMASRREDIGIELTHVADKEKQKKRRYADWKRAGLDLRQKSTSFGEKSYYAVKQREEIEAIECNLNVLEFQYARSISGGFKDSIFDYASLMHSEMRELSNAALGLIQKFHELENEIIMKTNAIKESKENDPEPIEPLNTKTRTDSKSPARKTSKEPEVMFGFNENVNWN